MTLPAARQLSEQEGRAVVSTNRMTGRLRKAYQRGYIKTIADLEAVTYGFPVTGGAGSRLAKDAPVLTDTSGFRNNLYGAKLWRMIQTEYNALGAIGAKPWSTSGYRAVTAAASTANPGITEGAAIPATLKPTVVEYNVNPFVSAISFDMSSTALKVNPKDDGVTWEELNAYMADEFKNRLNRALLANNDTVKTTGILSLDTVIASYAEIAYGKVDDSAVLDANDLDIYGKDRDAAASVNDAYVDGQAFGSGQRTFELSQLDNVFVNCRKYWANRAYSNKVIITGDDTAMRMAQLYASIERVAMPQKMVEFTVNGVKSVSGVNVGIEVAAYRGVPVIPDANVLQDTISRIYLADLDTLHLGTLTPPTYLFSDDYQALDKFAQEGVWYMEGELICTVPPGQGKVRDLK